MARWRVTQKHYLHAKQYGQPTEWAREETNRDTGRTFRKTMLVPLLIDPEDPFCQNRTTGMCVVAREGTEQPGDIVFFGPPTPDMEPLDEEARKETDSFKHRWKSPFDDMPVAIGADFGESMLMFFQRQLTEAQNGNPQNASMKNVDNGKIDELMKLVAAQQEQINKLLNTSVAVDASAPEPTQVIDEEPPLEEIDPEATIPPPVVKTPAKSSLRR